MTLADEQARASIASELDVNMLVEAAAGTGKTTSLVTRIVALIRTGRCDVASLAAITFTVKAAAQLRERVQEALEQAGETAAVDRLDRAFLGTTHAFCARMLRERPVEAGLDPEFVELDEVDTVLRMEEFWSRWYESQALRGSEAVQRVRETGVSSRQLRSTFFRLVDYADVEIVSSECDRPDLEGAVAAVLAFVQGCEPSFPNDSMREKQDDFERMMRDLVRKRDSSGLDTVREQLELLELGNHVTRKATLKNWPDRQAAKTFYQEYSTLAAGLVRPTVQRWREYVHCAVMGLLRPAVQAFEEERLREGTLTFNDLLLRARDLLRDHPSVRRSFQRRFTHVLVDEFQDTDPIQAEVLFYLTGEDTEERNWRKLRPRPGSLFIVGDPKQSIYRFRRADITTYLAVKTLIQESGGRIEQLQTNFRSPKPICEFVNATFRTLLDPAEVAAGRQAAHVDLAWNGEGGALSGMYVLETVEGRQDDVAREEGRCIAQWIRNAVSSGLLVDDGAAQRPARFGDFLLISDRKQRLPIYAEALEQEGIRYDVTGGEAFARSEDLQRVMPLLRAVADPDDAVSLAAFLRGPLCGASDDALYRFVRAGGRFSAFGTAPEGTDATIVAGLQIARAGIDLSRELPPAAALANLFEKVGLTALASAEEKGGTRAGNTLLALALARRESAAGAAFGDVVVWLDELLRSKAKIEELDVDPAATNVVRLMNLHQAKGLEAPVVFLIDPIESKDFDPDLYVDRSGETSRGYVAIRELAMPRDWSTLAAEELAFQRAEKKRLLYVAATRARSILVAGVTVKNGFRRGMWSVLARTASPLFASTSSSPNAESTSTPATAFAAIEERMASAREASYAVLPITKIAHDSHVELVRAEEGLGKGTSWGRVLHRLFEALVRDSSLDVRRFAENLLRDEERDPVEVEEVVNVVAAVRSSPLWARVLAADKRLVEVPFALMADVGGSGETLLHGVIDLCILEGSRWLIVDYKSDSTAGRLGWLIAYYKPQVEYYARFW
ncbi:MAG: UvrD-helicase domain-containing protein, partial [Acidobacteriota bacterium]